MTKTILAALCLATAALADEPAKAEAKPAEAAAKPAEAAAKPTVAKKAKAAMMIAPADLKWVDVPNMKGIQFAPLWGDAQKGAHGRFIKFAAGTDNPLHHHSSDLKSVVVSGTFYTGADAAAAKDLGIGSFALVPGGWKHVSGCRAGADCVIFEESGGKFDYVPAEKPAEAAK